MRGIWLKNICSCFIFLFAATACRADEASDPQNAELIVEPDEPAYGDEVSIKGNYVWGFETSAFYLCSETRKRCVSTAPLNGAGCWIEFTKEGFAQLSKLRPNDDDMLEGGEVWIEGSGRIARRPGNFGHLGGYSCQIQIASVYSVDAGPPYLFRPPDP